MPRWVRVFVVIGVLLLAVLVVGQFVGGGHGPSRHGPSRHDGGGSGHVPPSTHDR